MARWWEYNAQAKERWQMTELTAPPTHSLIAGEELGVLQGFVVLATQLFNEL